MNPTNLPRLRHPIARHLASRPSSRSSSTAAAPHAIEPTSRDTQSFTLPDGRTLAWAEYGPATGYPVLFFHGYPSSRLEVGPVAHIAARRNLRIITPDRPGFGLSTFQPNRRITSWPADVSSLASHLGLQRFAVLGGSGGGPYALACAAALPPEQMSAVGLLAGAPPWEAGRHEMPWFSRWLANATSYAPGLVRVVMDATVGGMRWIVRTNSFKVRIDRWLEAERKKEEERKEGQASSLEQQDDEKLAEETEEERLTTADRRERLLRLLFEPFAQGSTAAVQEAQLLTQPWGFRFDDVKYDRIQMWHGTHDVNAPVGMMRWMAKRLPYCELHESDNTHFTLVDELEGILGQLVPEREAKSQRPEKDQGAFKG